MTGRLPWGLELPLAPFFGVMAVAPPPAWGALSTLPPRRNGGNLDNKELVAGTTLYLPCFVDGGNFSVGDGHGAQGDGEVCITAIETGLIGRFTLTARADMGTRLADGRDADASDHHGRSIPISMIASSLGPAPYDQRDHRAHRPVARGRLYLVAASRRICASPRWSTATRGVHCMLDKTPLLAGPVKP